MICRNNTRERIDQLSIRIQLIEGLSVKYANAVEYKGPGRHSSKKQCLSKRRNFISKTPPTVKTSRQQKRQVVCQKLCDAVLCVGYFHDTTTHILCECEALAYLTLCGPAI